MFFNATLKFLNILLHILQNICVLLQVLLEKWNRLKINFKLDNWFNKIFCFPKDEKIPSDYNLSVFSVPTVLSSLLLPKWPNKKPTTFYWMGLPIAVIPEGLIKGHEQIYSILMTETNIWTHNWRDQPMDTKKVEENL